MSLLCKKKRGGGEAGVGLGIHNKQRLGNCCIIVNSGGEAAYTESPFKSYNSRLALSNALRG